MAEDPLAALLTRLASFRASSGSLEKAASQMGYKIIRSQRLEARIHAMTALHRYILEESRGATPEEKLGHIKQKLEVVCISLSEVAIPYLTAKDAGKTADLTNQYEQILGRCREYVDACTKIMELRGHDDPIDIDSDEEYIKSDRYIDKGALVDMLNIMIQRDVMPRLLQIKNISFSQSDLELDWVSGMMQPGKDKGGYPPTSLNYPRPTFGAEEHPESPGVQDWGPPRPARKKKEE